MIREMFGFLAETLFRIITNCLSDFLETLSHAIDFLMQMKNLFPTVQITIIDFNIVVLYDENGDSFLSSSMLQTCHRFKFVVHVLFDPHAQVLLLTFLASFQRRCIELTYKLSFHSSSNKLGIFLLFFLFSLVRSFSSI